MMLFETARLTVRQIGPGDAGFMLAVLNDPGFIANIGDRGVRTIEQADAYVRERVLASFSQHGFGFYHVALRAGGEAVGIVSLVRREGLDAPDLGFAILSAHQRRGYALEAARGLLGWAAAVLDLPPLVAFTAPHNAASAGLLARLGFREEGRVALPGIVGESRLFVAGARQADGDCDTA